VPSQPDNGLVSYAGTYAGLLNVGTTNGTLPVPPGTDPSLIPERASRVTGDIFLNADFTDNAVEGAITNRQSADLGTVFADVILVPTAIDGNGRFQGSAEAPGGQPAIGSYAGLFGGTGATSVAGGTHLQYFDDRFTNEEERGVFVLTRCGLAGDAPICDGVNPP
jgi:hypothetical protein